jgi:hypothetical protein
MLGIPIPSSFEGRSFWGTIINGESHRSTMFSAYKNKHRSIRGDRFKLIEYYVGDKIIRQMFDLVSDPLERDNLLKSGNAHEYLSSMQLKLSELQESFADPINKNNSS